MFLPLTGCRHFHNELCRKRDKQMFGLPSVAIRSAYVCRYIGLGHVVCVYHCFGWLENIQRLNSCTATKDKKTKNKIFLLLFILCVCGKTFIERHVRIEEESSYVQKVIIADYNTVKSSNQTEGYFGAD